MELSVINSTSRDSSFSANQKRCDSFSLLLDPLNQSHPAREKQKQNILKVNSINVNLLCLLAKRLSENVSLNAKDGMWSFKIDSNCRIYLLYMWYHYFECYLFLHWTWFFHASGSLPVFTSRSHWRLGIISKLWLAVVIALVLVERPSIGKRRIMLHVPRTLLAYFGGKPTNKGLAVRAQTSTRNWLFLNPAEISENGSVMLENLRTIASLNNQWYGLYGYLVWQVVINLRWDEHTLGWKTNAKNALLRTW